jgi:hypothetical protein
MSGEAFNRLVRIAAGRDVPAAPELERPVGDFGGGKGGSAMPRQRATSNADVNRRIRAGARIVRDVQLRDGLMLDLDDPFGGR